MTFMGERLGSKYPEFLEAVSLCPPHPYRDLLTGLGRRESFDYRFIQALILQTPFRDARIMRYAILMAFKEGSGRFVLYDCTMVAAVFLGGGVFFPPFPGSRLCWQR